MMAPEDAAARALTEFLFTAERGYAGQPGQSPVQNAIRGRLRSIAESIADEIIAGNPTIRQRIRERVEEAIRSALADDATLNSIVTESVAKALTRHYSDSED